MATAFLWQGFDHEWLRSVLGFRLPHRVSKLDSYISAEHGHAAEFHFGQAPGVDGNYMRPQGHYAAITADGLRVNRGVAQLRWTDEIETEVVPYARSVVTQAIPSDKVAVLRGIRLQTRCDAAKQPAGHPGNSNGMWPYHFQVGLADGMVRVHIERGWTPNRGGIPGIEEKPLTQRLDFELDVEYTVLGGDSDVLAVTRGDAAVAQADAGATEHTSAVTAIAGAAGRFPVAAVGLTGFGFELLPPTDSKRHQHRGRYLGAIGMQSRLSDYHPNTGLATIAHRSRVWLPVTVVRSQARYTMQPVLLQLAGPGAAASVSQVVRGSLCSESSPDAPFFSHWKRCGDATTGPGQTSDSQRIVASFDDLSTPV